MHIEDVFLPGRKVVLSVAESRFPLRFHPVINRLEPRRLALDLPPRWERFGMLSVGTRVYVSIHVSNSLYGLDGEIAGIDPEASPSLWVDHDGQLKQVQRRTYYRLDYQAPLTIVRVVLPSGEDMGPLSGTLVDLSAGGIGFTLERPLPPDTLLDLPRLFEPLVLLPQPDAHRLSVRWCRPQASGGFRAGAIFCFADPEEQDRVARIVHQLQHIRLSRY